MGIKIEVLDPTPDCPASVVAKQTLGSFKEPASIRYMWLSLPQIQCHGTGTLSRIETQPSLSQTTTCIIHHSRWRDVDSYC